MAAPSAACKAVRGKRQEPFFAPLCSLPPSPFALPPFPLAPLPYLFALCPSPIAHLLSTLVPKPPRSLQLLALCPLPFAHFPPRLLHQRLGVLHSLSSHLSAVLLAEVARQQFRPLSAWPWRLHPRPAARLLGTARHQRGACRDRAPFVVV